MTPSKAWRNGNAHTPFRELFGLQRVNETTFLSTHPAYGPGDSLRSYGGHVFAQSMLAAAQTCKPGFVVHSITGHFLQIGRTDVPFEYRVLVVREGGGYVQRRVEVVQEGGRVVFCAICSFKRPERNVVSRWRTADLRERYSELRSRREEEWPVEPGIDSPFWWKMEEKMGPDRFPGLEMRKVGLDEFNRHRKTLDRRQLHLYRVRGGMPKVEDDPNLHAAGHLYASDRSLFPVPNFLDMGDEYSSMASLSHTVVFHPEVEGLNLVDSNGSPKWFCSEEAIEHVGHGRALAIFKLWDMSTNKPIASAMQDGLVRMTPGVASAGEFVTVFEKTALKAQADAMKAKL